MHGTNNIRGDVGDDAKAIIAHCMSYASNLIIAREISISCRRIATFPLSRSLCSILQCSVNNRSIESHYDWKTIATHPSVNSEQCRYLIIIPARNNWNNSIHSASVANRHTCATIFSHLPIPPLGRFSIRLFVVFMQMKRSVNKQMVRALIELFGRKRLS